MQLIDGTEIGLRSARLTFRRALHPPSRFLRWTPEYASPGDAIMTERDKRLVAEYLDVDATVPRRLAIVYGAAHMRAVIRELTRQRNFHCVESEWMVIFPLERETEAFAPGAEAR